MSPILRKDLENVLPKVPAHSCDNAEEVLGAIEGLLPEHRGAYTISEVAAALGEFPRRFADLRDRLGLADPQSIAGGGKAPESSSAELEEYYSIKRLVGFD
jgi:hypothetical protein